MEFFVRIIGANVSFISDRNNFLGHTGYIWDKMRSLRI